MSERAKAVSEPPHSAYFAHTVRRAYSVAARRGSAIVALEHFLYALLDDPEALALMEGCGADIASIRVELTKAIEKNTPRELLSKGEAPQAGKGLRHVLLVSQKGTRESGRSEVDGAVALAALVGQSDAPVARLLNKHGLSFGKALGWIDAQNTRGPHDPPAQARPARSPQAPEPQAAPDPAPPAKREAPPRPSRDIGPEPTLEDMLATIRDVMEEEDAPPPVRETSHPAAPRKTAPPAPAPSGKGQQRVGNPQAAPRERPALAEHPVPARTRSSGASSARNKRRRAGDAAAPPQPVSMLGKLVERIPRVMREGEHERVEVRIGREATDELIDGLQGRGATHVHGVTVTRAMSLYLRAPDGGFMIEPLTPETQWVFDRPSFLDSEPFGQWQWVVLPMKQGSRKLQLVAAARSVDENGMIGDVALPEQVIEVRVRINWARSLMKAALWASLAIAGGVLSQIAVQYLPGLTG